MDTQKTTINNALPIRHLVWRCKFTPWKQKNSLPCSGGSLIGGAWTPPHHNFRKKYRRSKRKLHDDYICTALDQTMDLTINFQAFPFRSELNLVSF